MTKRKLDLSMIEQSHEKFERKRLVDIPVMIEGKSQMAVLEIDEIFAPSKIDACIREFVGKVDAIRKSNGEAFKYVLEAYLIFLIIKYFTDFPAPTTYKEQVKIINMMAETELLYTIYSKFDQKELDKIYEAVEGVSGVLEENLSEYINLAKEIGIDKALENFEEGEVYVKS